MHFLKVVKIFSPLKLSAKFTSVKIYHINNYIYIHFIFQSTVRVYYLISNLQKYLYYAFEFRYFYI